MARIAGVDLPKEKRVEIGLTYIYGIGLSSSQKILAKAGINPDTRVKDLTDEQENAIRKIIDESYNVEFSSTVPWLNVPVKSLGKVHMSFPFNEISFISWYLEEREYVIYSSFTEICWPVP